MTVKLTKIADPICCVTFTWSNDLQDCNMLAECVTDQELDAMMDANAHEGASFSGWETEIK